MAFLNRKKSEDKLVDDRQRVITYKKFFETAEGKEILMDLMNNFSLGLNSAPLLASNELVQRSMGRNDVICHIFARANQNMEVFDKLLKGELT